MVATNFHRKDVPVFVLIAGNEIPAFTACFHGWDFRKTKVLSYFYAYNNNECFLAS
jgi:hypothetical protein